MKHLLHQLYFCHRKLLSYHIYLNNFCLLTEKYQLRYSVEWWLSGQPFLTGRGKLVDAVVNAIEHYNEIKPQLLTNGGTSDGRFIARMGAQVVELGPVNATIHKINECVNAADLQLLARMYQRVMEQLVA